MDSRRYVGYDAELFFEDHPIGHGRVCTAEDSPIDRMLERLDEHALGHKVIVISCHNRQLAELADCLGLAERIVEPRFLIQDAPHGPRKGKGQRKANRGSRWQ